MSLELQSETSSVSQESIEHRVLRHVVSLAEDFDPHQPEADDVKHSFFERGRDLESAYVNHKYTEKEKEILRKYESLDYLPPHSKVYRDWVRRQPSRLDWDRWLMMGLIGFFVGILGFFLHQFIDVFAEIKWDKARKFIEEENFIFAWLWVIGLSLTFVFISSSSVVLLRPSAAGSGLPEIIAYLNGALVRHIFNVKTLGVKFFSCIFAVASGLPVGPEGPMVHLGALVGAGCSQFRSSTLKFRLPFFSRFRNPEDRRNFISAGAAAGVASAFGAPVGGLLFSMEEVSSFWNMKLSWQTFFCCMVSTFTTDLFNSAFSAFHYQGNFGLFKTEKYILFQVDNGIALNIIALLPAMVIGAAGGILGAAFTFLNLKIARARRKIVSSRKSKWHQKALQISEPMIIMVLMGTLTLLLPAVFSCTKFNCHWTHDQNPGCVHNKSIHIESSVEYYTCPKGINKEINGSVYTNKTYNEAATLLFLTGERAIKHLFSRETHFEFNFASLLVILPCYFLLACWSAGSSIASGVVVPKMFIGGMMGRLIGRVLVEISGVYDDPFWQWMDPGAFALLGAAAFFGGVSRLTMSLTVIMVELTNDVQFLLLIMVVIMVAKWVGDYATHPFYHSLLEFKCIPFLDSEPVVLCNGKKNLNLDLFECQSIMCSPVVTLEARVSVSKLAKVMLSCQHSGFPVSKSSHHSGGKFYGIITRTEIYVLLCHESSFEPSDSGSSELPDLVDVDYLEFCDDYAEKLSHSGSFKELLISLSSEMYENKILNLAPYVNRSAICVHQNFSLHRTYIIFRSLGLRHLTVVNADNQIVGIITRKDLMGYNIEEKLIGKLESCSN